MRAGEFANLVVGDEDGSTVYQTVRALVDFDFDAEHTRIIALLTRNPFNRTRPDHRKLIDILVERALVECVLIPSYVLGTVDHYRASPEGDAQHMWLSGRDQVHRTWVEACCEHSDCVAHTAKSLGVACARQKRMEKRA